MSDSNWCKSISCFLSREVGVYTLLELDWGPSTQTRILTGWRKLGLFKILLKSFFLTFLKLELRLCLVPGINCHLPIGESLFIFAHLPSLIKQTWNHYSPRACKCWWSKESLFVTGAKDSEVAFCITCSFSCRILTSQVRHASSCLIVISLA